MNKDMSSVLSIKVNIAGRNYPLTIERDEEEVVRRAAQSINENIKKLQANYAVRDIQDLLAMTSLQFSTDLLTQTKSIQVEQDEKEIKKLAQKINMFLNK